MKTIYLDHAATTPIRPEVVRKITDVMQEVFGNPSSIHAYGRQARHLLDEARAVIAGTLNATYQEIVFTSGGTEADNMAIIGTALANQDRGRHIITTAIEHHAVLHACEYLEGQDFQVTYLQPDAQGVVSAEKVSEALRGDTILVTMMYANNEVGALQPIGEVGELLAEHQAKFHTDAVQAYGTEIIDVEALKVDLLSLSAHKINGPKGVGALYIRKGTAVQPLAHGGSQEAKRRAGTENLAAISGFAEAAAMKAEEKESSREAIGRLKEIFFAKLASTGTEFAVNGNPEGSVPHILNLSFPGTDVESLLVNLDLEGIAVSSGSACTAGSLEPSHVLTAIFGSGSERSGNSVRFSFGHGNTEDEAEKAAEKTADVVKRLRG